MLMAGGTNICGATIGVLCLDSRFPKPPGHIKNPSGLSFPVLYETVRGATVAELINRPSPEFIAPFVDAAQRLEADGVRAITGSCGFLALYQKELASSVKVPVFASSLIQVPLAHAMLPVGQTVGVLTADARSLTDRHFAAVGAGTVPVAVAGMETSTEFREVILEAQRDELDFEKVGTEILDSAARLIADNPDIGALVLECTDMPPFAAAIQERFKVPVFDLTTLATMVHQVVYRQPYAGINPPTVTTNRQMPASHAQPPGR